MGGPVNTISKMKFIYTSLLVSQILAYPTFAAAKYTIQVSSHSGQAEAEDALSKLKQKGLSAFETKSDIPGKGIRYRVNVGSFNTLKEAATFKKNLTHSNQLSSDAIVQRMTGEVVQTHEAAASAPVPSTPSPPPTPDPSPAPTTASAAATPPATTASSTLVPEQIQKVAPAVKVTVKGFSAVEFEQSKNFGFDSDGIQSFNSLADGAERANMNFFANLKLDIKKGYTSLATLVQVGELFFGDSNTGGSQGAAGKIFKLKNIYIEHEFTDNFNAKAGVLHITPDPRGFILNDDFGSAFLDYKTLSFAGSLWFAQAYLNPPGLAGSVSPATYTKPDIYWGVNTSLNFTNDIKASVYGVYRKTFERLTAADLVTLIDGESSYYWAGITAEYIGFPFSADATYILNSSNFTNATVSDNNSAGLADARLKLLWAEPEILVSIEGLTTTGGSDVMSNGYAVINKRKNFSAPTQGGSSYMFLIATSNGYVDAPGTKKSNVIAPLNLSEGLTAYSGKITKNFGPDFLMYVTYGALNSTTNQATTQSNVLGTEFDIGVWGKLSSETSWQFDYGSFMPGAYYTSKDPAYMFATRVKYEF